MNCLIIDHNATDRIALQQLASQIDDLTVTNEFGKALEAYNYLQSNQVDLLFLNVEMPDISGLELTKQLKNKDLIIIFTTSTKDYAVEAFELDAADYLVKPFTTSRFIQSIDKARNILTQKQKGMQAQEAEYIFVRDTNVVRRLRLDDILYAKAMGDFVKFYTKNKMYAIHGKLKSAEMKLPLSNFVRVHRSYIVALNKIDALQDGGVIIQDQFLPVAETYRKGLNSRMIIF